MHNKTKHNIQKNTLHCYKTGGCLGSVAYMIATYIRELYKG